MLQAQLRGKLTRSEENMEDLLVSDVFGSIKYLMPQEGLIPIIISSEDANGKAPNFRFDAISDAKYEFWPWLEEPSCNGCEPDVLITLHLNEHEKIILLIEAKYLSDKSSEEDGGTAPQDQLAREYDNLEKKAKRENATSIFMYITARMSYPKDSVIASVSEYTKKRNAEMHVFWISWRKITRLFPNAKKGSILSDVTQILEKQGLVFFEGISKTEPIRIEWSYESTINWDWSFVKNFPINWKFEKTGIINWQQTQIEEINWRFKK
jgi:hypothetical protein